MDRNSRRQPGPAEPPPRRVAWLGYVECTACGVKEQSYAAIEPDQTRPAKPLACCWCGKRTAYPVGHFG